MSGYKFYDIQTKQTPKQSYIDDFEAMFDMVLENAPNYFDNIQEERVVGSKVLYLKEGRVDSVIDPSTNKNAGDDYKLFIFRPEEPKQFVGKLYFWENNYWLCVNTNSYETLANYAIVKRCNNSLRWIDSNGILREEPCSIGYDIFQPRDFSTKDYKLGSGQITLQVQKTAVTNLIKPNMRFLFGTKENRRAYKIFGDGIVNYLNRFSLDDDSASVLAISLGSDYVNNETDDLENGIANAYENSYTISIDQDDVSQSVGFEGTLTATVLKDGILFNGEVEWKSSDTSLCVINANGEYELLDEGSVTITATLKSNKTISDTIVIEIVSVPVEDFDIRIEPNYFNINEGDEVAYTCYLYLNEIQQADVFEFSVVGAVVPNYKYDITVLGDNSFKIRNNQMYLTNPLSIKCISGIHNKTFEFNLRGAF